MKKNISFSDEHAVSELVGGLILILIALITFSAIYMYVFPLPIEPAESNVKLMGHVTDEGLAVIEHMGGSAISSYKIDVRYTNGTLIDTTTYREVKDPWEIGEKIYPLTDIYLITEENIVQVIIYNIHEDGSKEAIFDGILKGKGVVPVFTPSGDLMLFSSLQTNTTDEDLICYNYTINPDALTYIYNWSVDGSSMMDLLMSFDTNVSQNDIASLKDYSGQGNNGTLKNFNFDSNSGWRSSSYGKVGGAYEFDGIDDYISLPYCFESGFIDEITIESWIKTEENSGVIASFDDDILWELGLTNGLVRWSTNASDGTTDTIGVTDVNDGSWHYVVTTYDWSTGDCVIYVDGEVDKNENGHDQWEKLGSGDTPTGSIGLGSELAEEIIFSTGFETQDEKNSWDEHNQSEEEETWNTLAYDDFNSGYGSYTDGGDDCSRISDYKHEGSHSVRLRDDTSSSRCTLTNGIDVSTPEYTSIKVDFWWMWNDYWGGWTSGEDWWVRFSDDGGNSWETVFDMNYPSGYAENTWYHQIIYINETDYTFTNNIKIRFQCDASWDNDRIYFDQIYINASGGSRIDYDFDLRDSGALNPRTEPYSLGGSGDFDPEYAAFNRTGIDISGYSDVNVSVWYSYKDTESDDFLGLYYKDGEDWAPIFEDDNPQIGSGQSNWINVEGDIPDYINDLVLQFKWMTSSTSEYVAIDDLEITGIPLGSGNNFSGMIDEFHIYNRALSGEQIYQNYLCTKDGLSDKSVIVSDETGLPGEIWKCTVTPNDGDRDDDAVISNILIIKNL